MSNIKLFKIRLKVKWLTMHYALTTALDKFFLNTNIASIFRIRIVPSALQSINN